MTVTIDKFGRVLIPKHVRTRIGVQAGDRLVLEVSDTYGSLELHPAPVESAVKSRIVITDWGWPVIVTEPATMEDFDVVEAIRQDREERANKVMGLNHE